MVLGGWGSVNLSHLFLHHPRASAALNEKGEVTRQQLSVRVSIIRVHLDTL